MKARNAKIKKFSTFIVILLAFTIIFINTDKIFTNQINVSFDPYDPPSDPPSPPSNPPPPALPTNQNPVANITMPEICYVNETVIMHGNYSYDSDGSIQGYRWDFENDGLWDTDWNENPFTTHIFNQTGNYTVKLQVKDNDGATDIQTQDIQIIEIEPDKQRPIAENNGPYWSTIGKNITFSSKGSYDPDGNITSWLWEFGDGNSSNQSNPVYSYNKSGSYIITLTVWDNDGLIDQDFTTANIKTIFSNNTISENKTSKKEVDDEKDQTTLLLSLMSIVLAIIITTIAALIIVKENQQKIENQKSKNKKTKSKKKTKKKKKNKKQQKPKSSKKTKKKSKKPKNNKKRKNKKKKTKKTTKIKKTKQKKKKK